MTEAGLAEDVLPRAPAPGLCAASAGNCYRLHREDGAAENELSAGVSHGAERVARVTSALDCLYRRLNG